MNKEKSLKGNMCLNAIRSLMGIIFPLVTFPYASKILGISNIGKYNFSNSVITYFSLIAELGICTYAIREGSKLRDKKVDLNVFINEIFTMNIISTIFSYVLLALCLTSIEKFEDYKLIIVIMSLLIVSKTVGIEYIYSIFEDYFYVTVRTIIFQFISLALLFLFVKSSDDLLIYTMICVFSNGFSNVVNFIYARKYCKVKIVRKPNVIKHLKPIMILFGMSVTVAVYVASDVTILGFLCNDTVVGRYSVSTKIYSIVKTMLSAILVVSIPRLAGYLGKQEIAKFQATLEEISKILLTFMLPIIVGILMLRKPIILLISSEEYIDATSSLLLLAIALFFCMGAWFWGQCVLVPLKQEHIVFKITVISAVLNIILNLVLIPIWQENAAAFTTLLAEGFSYVCCAIFGKKYVNKLNIGQCIYKVSIGCVFIIAICKIFKRLVSDEIILLFMCISVSAVVYFLVEIILRNSVIYDVISSKFKLSRRV